MCIIFLYRRSKLKRCYLNEFGECFLISSLNFPYLKQNKSGWWGRNCQKINLSANSLLQYLPAFFSYQPDPDVIIQIVVDNTRFVLYTLSTKGNIVMYDLGADGTCADNRTTISFSETFFAIKRLIFYVLNIYVVLHKNEYSNKRICL